MGVGAKWAEELRGAGSHKVGLVEVVRVATEDIGSLGNIEIHSIWTTLLDR